MEEGFAIMWRWIDGYINIGILALALSIAIPGLMSFSLSYLPERIGLPIFIACMWIGIPLVLFLGIGGAYLMTR